MVFGKTKKRWMTLPPTRFKTIFANDIRPSIEKVWASFFENHYGFDPANLHIESIVDRVKRYWDGETGLFPENVDIVTGGFPCQDFFGCRKKKRTKVPQEPLGGDS